MKDVIIAVVTLIGGIVIGVLFGRPAANELAALQALAKGEAAKALAIYNRVKGAL